MIYDRKNRRPLTAEQQKLVADNLALVHFVLKRHKGFMIHLGYEDAFQTGCLGLMRAAQRFNPSRGSFSGLACTEIHHALWNTLRIEGAKKRTPPNGCVAAGNLQDIIVSDDPSPEEAYEKNVLRRAARALIDHDKLLHDYYELGKTQRQIAMERNVSQTVVFRMIRRKLQAARAQLELC